MFRRDWMKTTGAGMAALFGARKAEAGAPRSEVIDPTPILPIRVDPDGQVLTCKAVPESDRVTLIRTRPIACDYLPKLDTSLLGTVNDAPFGPYPAGTVQLHSFHSTYAYRASGAIEGHFQYWLVQRPRPWVDRRLGEHNVVCVAGDGRSLVIKNRPPYRPADYGLLFPDVDGLLRNADLADLMPAESFSSDWG
jgi:hypothetical protein